MQINSLRRLGAGGPISGPFQDLGVGMRRRGPHLCRVSTVGLVFSAHLTRQYCPYTVGVVDWEWFITITGLHLLGLTQTRQKVGVDSVDPRISQLVLTPPPLVFHTSASSGAAITSSIDFQG